MEYYMTLKKKKKRKKAVGPCVLVCKDVPGSLLKQKKQNANNVIQFYVF